MFQLVISAIIVTMAVAYAVWRIRRVLVNADSRCYGCPIKDACCKGNTAKVCLMGGKKQAQTRKMYKKVCDDEKN